MPSPCPDAIPLASACLSQMLGTPSGKGPPWSGLTATMGSNYLVFRFSFVGQFKVYVRYREIRFTDSLPTAGFHQGSYLVGVVALLRLVDSISMLFINDHTPLTFGSLFVLLFCGF